MNPKSDSVSTLARSKPRVCLYWHCDDTVKVKKQKDSLLVGVSLSGIKQLQRRLTSSIKVGFSGSKSKAKLQAYFYLATSQEEESTINVRELRDS